MPLLEAIRDNLILRIAGRLADAAHRLQVRGTAHRDAEGLRSPGSISINLQQLENVIDTARGIATDGVGVRRVGSPATLAWRAAAELIIGTPMFFTRIRRPLNLVSSVVAFAAWMALGWQSGLCRAELASVGALLMWSTVPLVMLKSVRYVASPSVWFAHLFPLFAGISLCGDVRKFQWRGLAEISNPMERTLALIFVLGSALSLGCLGLGMICVSASSLLRSLLSTISSIRKQSLAEHVRKAIRIAAIGVLAAVISTCVGLVLHGLPGFRTISYAIGFLLISAIVLTATWLVVVGILVQKSSVRAAAPDYQGKVFHRGGLWFWGVRAGRIFTRAAGGLLAASLVAALVLYTAKGTPMSVDLGLVLWTVFVLATSYTAWTQPIGALPGLATA